MLEKKAQKNKCNTTLERTQKDSLYRDSSTKIGWDENIIIAYDEIAKEDHLQCDERGKTPKRKLVETCDAESAHGPLDQKR